MQRPDSIDSRLILRGYAVATVVAGLVVVNYRWPVPATLTIDRVTIPSLWSLMLVSAGDLIWLSGAVAWALSSLENPAARLRVLRGLAVVLILIGANYYAPAFPILRVLLPNYAAWGPIIAGAALLLLSFDPRSRSVRRPLSLAVTYRDRKRPSLKLLY